MLVLSRRVGESIVIGEDICLTVIAIDKREVKLGFTAPRDVPINRQEVARRLSQQAASEKQ